MTDLERLERAGRLLHGPSWQTPLAADLGVALRTVQRWASGASALPSGIWADLRKLLLQRSQEAARFAETLQGRGLVGTER
jgi:hypothetical protein